MKVSHSISAALRHYVTIEEPVEVADGLGGFVRSWAALASVWAAIEPRSSRERLFGGQLESQVTHIITLRYRDDVTADMRITHGIRVFTIRSVIDPDERGEILEILAEEGGGS